MLCECHWIMLYTVHFTAFCLGGPVFSRTRCRCIHNGSTLWEAIVKKQLSVKSTFIVLLSYVENNVQYVRLSKSTDHKRCRTLIRLYYVFFMTMKVVTTNNLIKRSDFVRRLNLHHIPFLCCGNS